MEENKQANEMNEALKGMWDSLTDEQREKAKECKSMDELMRLAGKLGVELPDEMLEGVAGGWFHFGWGGDSGGYNSGTLVCPICGSEGPAGVDHIDGIGDVQKCHCPHCGDIYKAIDGCWYDKNGKMLFNRFADQSKGNGC
ncbi:MAG: hypothetical protein IJU66_01675 [Oscillospiraceae bacterium]|nr:hypothetical protein [Oscillospiraceae bacterium]